MQSGPHAAQGFVPPGGLRCPGGLTPLRASQCWGPSAIRAPPQPRAELREAAQASSASTFPRRCLWPGTGWSCGLALSRSRHGGSPGSRCPPQSFPRLGGTCRGGRPRRGPLKPRARGPPRWTWSSLWSHPHAGAAPAEAGRRPGPSHAWKPLAEHSFLPSSRGTRLGGCALQSQGHRRAALRPPSPSLRATSLEGSSLTQSCARPSGWALAAQRAAAVGEGGGEQGKGCAPGTQQHHYRPYSSIRHSNHVSSQPQPLL